MNHHKAIKGLFVVLIILGVITGIVIYSLFGTYFALKANPIAAFPNKGAESVASDHVNYDANANVETVGIDGQIYQKNSGVISILMLGIDWDGTVVKDETGARSDMLMLCTIDTKSNQISFLSIPRDTRTIVHKVDQETGKVDEKENLTKINHAYILGGGNNPKLYGPQNAMRATEDLIECDGQLNIPVQQYISIDLEHLPEFADAFGGVDVMLDQDVPGVGGEGETVTLEGETVRLYLQNRKEQSDGEMDRQRHQQTFIKALAKKIKQMGAVQSASRLFTQLNNNVIQTNLNLDQIIAMAGVLDKVESVDDIKMETFSETDDSWQKFPDPIVSHPAKLDYYIMDQQEILDKMLGLYYIAVG